MPWATIAVFIVTAAVTAFQFLDPTIVTALYRRPGGLAAGEWWRPLTALFVHPEGLQQIVADLAGLALIGTVTERAFGAGRWLILYFVSGVLAHLVGFLWQPGSAGSSVGTAGLLGGLAVWLLSRPPPFPLRGPLGGAVVLAAGIGLTACRDIHGPPILTGVLLGVVFVWPEWQNAR